MTSKVAYEGTANASDILTAANYNKGPGGVIGWVTRTSDQALSAGTEADLTGLTETVTVGSGRLLRIEAVVKYDGSAANDHVTVRLYEDGTIIQGVSGEVPTASRNDHVNPVCYVTPASGSHTYKVSAQRTAGSGTITVRASSTNPNQLIIQDLGSTS